MTRAALYTRVSTEEQRRGLSPDHQVKELKAYAKSRGWKVAGQYSDLGKSAFKNFRKRTAYHALMENKADWDVLIVTKLDRAHRNIKTFSEMCETFEAESKGFVAIKEGIDLTTETGLMVAKIVCVLAEWEARQTRGRVNGIVEYRAEFPICLGPPPFGYQILPAVRLPDGSRIPKGRLEVVDDQAAVIRAIFERYAVGEDCQTIAYALNVAGAPAPSFGLAKGRVQWRKANVRHVLANVAYRGDRAGRFPRQGIFPRIIDDMLWIEAQRRLSANKARHGRNRPDV